MQAENTNAEAVNNEGTVRPIYRTGTPLPYKHPILYIFSTNNCTEFFKHEAHSLFFLFKMLFIS
jgi:hypothetical protein